MTDLKKVSKLLGKLQLMIEELETQPVIVLHQNINQFYYMQKSTELQLLHNQLMDIMEKEALICIRLTNHYGEVCRQWKKDKRWLTLFLREAKRNTLMNSKEGSRV